MKFITGESAVLVDDMLVLGELHLGMESELYSKGVYVPSGTLEIKERIKKLIKKTRSKKIVILGDVKHNYLKVSKQEDREIPEFFRDLAETAEVHITLGNHDALLESILPKEVILHESGGFAYGDYFFCHGNAWPSQDLKKCKYLFMGHIHPAVEFIDKLSYRHVELCWIRGQADNEKLEERYGKISLEEVIIVPPFNRRISGMPVNRGFKEKDINPLTRNGIVDIEACEVYLLDGTHLGRVSSIKKTDY